MKKQQYMNLFLIVGTVLNFVSDKMDDSELLPVCCTQFGIFVLAFIYSILGLHATCITIILKPNQIESLSLNLI